VGDDPAGVGVGAGGQRVPRRPRPGGRVDADHRAVEGDRVPAGAQVLAAQGAALGRRGAQGGAHAARRVAAGVERTAVLAVVDEVEAGAVAAAGVQVPVGAELHRADGVARVLLAPVLDQDLLGTGHDVAGGLQARQAPADDAAVVGRPRWGGAGVGVDAGGPPARRRGGRAEHVVVGVEDIDVGVGGEVRGKRHPEQAPVPEVVDVDVEVGEDVRGGVGHGVEDLDDAALLGDEDPPVGGEADRGRVRQTAEHDRLLEAGGQGGRPRRRRRGSHHGRQRPEDEGHRQRHGQAPASPGGTAAVRGQQGTQVTGHLRPFPHAAASPTAPWRWSAPRSATRTYE
jgi:hypothetical protein